MSNNKNQAYIDAKTGLKNYEGFTMDFEELSSNAIEKCEDLTLAMIDIDRFKKVNDDFGHAAGDEVLLTLTKHLQKNTPESALLYRYSADEFAVLLPATEKEAAFLMMEKIRESICNDSGEAENPLKPKITLSIGIACCPEDGSRTNELVRKAEGALYRAKVGGRNKVNLSREEKMVTKTSHYTYEQLQRLSVLAKKEGVGEAVLLREALDDLLIKYDN